MNELLKALAPAKRRLRLQRLLQGAGAGFAFGALAARKMLRMIAGEKEESTIIPWNLIERDSLPAKYR